MEALKKHKITHLSASNINTFITSPAEWVMSYIYKLPYSSSAAAERGKYIEKALFHILGNGESVDKVIEEQSYFFAETCKEMKINEEEYLKEKEFVQRAIKVLPKHLSKFGKIIGYQNKIGYNYKGIDIIGYTDFDFELHDGSPLILDLKTSKKLNVSVGHKIAQHIYKTATNKPNKLFYVQVLKKDEKVMEYELTDEDNVKIPILILQAIENMNYLCSLANSKDDFKRLITPNPDDWKWNDETKLKARKDIWGF
jgi:hypothetical protein